jgi:hypothetical protein
MDEDFGTRWKEKVGCRHPTSIFADYGTPKNEGEHCHRSATVWAGGGEGETEDSKKS